MEGSRRGFGGREGRGALCRVGVLAEQRPQGLAMLFEACAEGIGVGVPLSRVYAHFMGGSLEWETASWQRHTTAVLTLPRDGFTF